MEILQKNKQFILSAVFFVASFTYIFAIDFNGLYGQDAYAYLRYSKELKQFFLNGAHPTTFYWPVLYPVVSSVLSFVINPILSLQLISIASMALTFYFISKILETLYGKNNSTIFFIAVAWCTSPYMFRLGVSNMSDMMAILFMVMCLYYLLCFKNGATLKSWMLAISCAAIAVFTHYSAAIILIPMLLQITITLFRQIKISSWISGFAFAVLIASITFYFNPQSINSAVTHPLLMNWNFKNMLSNSFETSGDGNHIYPMPNLIFVLSVFTNPGFGLLIPLAILVTFLTSRQLLLNPFCNWSVVIYLVFLAGLPEQNIRLLSLIFPLIIVMVLPAWNHLQEKFSRRIIHGILAIAFIANIILIPISLKAIILMNKNEKQIALEIKKFHSDKTIYSLGTKGMLQAYDVKNKMIDIWETKLISVDSNCIVLLNEKNLQEQWRNKLPYQNYIFLKSNLGLKNASQQIADWNIYVVTK